MSNKSNNIKFEDEDDLQKYFHSVHSFIRNKFGLYGKAALQFFNFFFVLKVIEPFIESGQIEFNKDVNNEIYEDETDCRYSTILTYNSEDDKINHIDNIKKKIFKSAHKHTFFMNFPIDRFDTKKSSLSEFLNKLNQLTPEIMNKFHVYGRVYEYFLGHITGRNTGSRSGSQMEDLGQFFTSRQLVRYCIAKVNPVLKFNSTVPKMGDLFCGSCGFITEYIKYLNYFDKSKKINWSQNISNIFGFDTDAEILKSGRVDIMTLTETFDDNSNVFKNNFRNVNSFEENLTDTDGNNFKLDFNFTNPPYGNSGKTTEEDKLKMISASDEIKYVASTGSIRNLTPPKNFKSTKSKPFLINGDNKETLAILHGMGCLNDGGTYCGILKEGCFFDKKFGDLRKYLSTYYEVDYVISVPQDDFLNTSTKTSILIYRNTGKKTSEIKFCELTPIKIKVLEKEKIIGFNEINPQTKKLINDFLCEDYIFTKQSDDYIKVGFDELEKNNFSFNFKNYIKEDITASKGFKIVKLGDIIKYKPKTNHGAQEGEATGKYVYYTSSQKIKYSNYLDIDNELCIIIGTGGEGSLYLDDNFGMSQHMFAFNCENIHLTTYVYYYLKHNWDKLYDKCFNGSTLKCLNKTNLDSYELPIPENIETIKLYLDYLEPANQTLQTLQTLQTQKEASICGKIKLLTSMGKEGEDYDEFKLGDVIETKSGKFNTKNMSNTGEYPFYNASINSIGTHNEYCFDKDKYIILVKSGNIHAHGLGSVNLVCNKIAAVSDMVMIYSKITTVQNDYLYYFLISIKNNIRSTAETTTGLGHISLTKVKDMKIRILKPHIISKYKLDDDFIFMDKLKNDIQNTLKIQEETTKQMMSMILDITTHQTSINLNTKTDTHKNIQYGKLLDSMHDLKTMPDLDIIINESQNIIIEGNKFIKSLNYSNDSSDKNSDNGFDNNSVKNNFLQTYESKLNNK